MKKLYSLALSLLLAVGTMSAQSAGFKGQVLSKDDDSPLPGAVVKVAGTQVAAVTDIDGHYLLSGASEGAQIEVSYVGFETALLTLKPDLKIYLETKSEMMDEIMVVAFGKQKKESFTGSASVVSSKDIEMRQVTTPLEALNGKVTGLQMLETNSITSSPSITIRGIGSLNASTSPLIVLDGLPYSGYWTDINPADIESMTVLKDAASNALYGARGANGVILINTKNAGRSKTRVSASAKWGAHTDGRVKYDLISDPGQYYLAHYGALKNYYVNSQGLTPDAAHVKANSVIGGPQEQGGLGYMVYSVPQGQGLIGTNGQLNPYATLGNRVYNNGQYYTLYPDDWTKEGLRDGFRQEYNVNLTGGNDKYSIYASLGYLGDEGLSYGTDLQRITARLKSEYQAYSFLRIGVNSSFTHTVSNTYDNVFSTLMDIGPVYPLYIRDGEGNILTDRHGKVYDYGVGDNGGCIRPVDNNGNYIQEDKLQYNRQISNAFNISGFANVDFLKHFRFTANASAYVTEARTNSAINPYYGYSSNESIGGSVDVYHYRTANLNAQQLLTYKQSFGKHNVDVIIGHEYTRDDYTDLSAGRTKLAFFDDNKELDGAIVNGSMASSSSKYNVEGFFGRAQYDFAERYFLSASFRRDGSSNFHPDHRWGNFWSVGGAWILSKESWFPQSWWVNMLKVKLSYGEQGNDGIGQNRYRDTYSISNSDGKIAYIFNSKGNENITW